MTLNRNSIITAALILVLTGSLRANDRIGEAIDAGTDYLLGQVKDTQVGTRKEGQVALETYALVVSGISVNHPLIKRNFDYLFGRLSKSKHTYTLACYIFALDAAISQIEQDLLILAPAKVQVMFKDDPRIGKLYRPHLKKAVDNLASIQMAGGGGWSYGPSKDRFDNSNVQFAVLGLGVGAKRNIPINRKVWLKIMDHFVLGQQEKGPEVQERVTMMKPSDIDAWNSKVKLIDGDKKEPEPAARKGAKPKKSDKGRTTVVVTPENPEVGLEGIKVYSRGFDYTNKGGATWNMTCAGLSSLILAREVLDKKVPKQHLNALNKAVRDGYGYLMTHWKPTGSYYGMYSLEKVGDLGDIKLFNKHDWFEEMSSYLIGQQRADGSWVSTHGHGENGEPRIASSFALLILNRASSLITKNPNSRIIVSGKSNPGESGARDWVFIPALDKTIHYPTLMRHIRMRPNVKLIKFLENIVENYPQEFRGELIPDMASVRDSIRSKSVRTVIDAHLEQITGYEYKDWKDYLKWHRRWERVMEIGVAKKKENVQDLLTYYASTKKSVTLRKAVMWALVQCQSREALPLLLADLDNAHETVRRSAYGFIKAYFINFPPSFNAAAAEATRKTQAEKVRAWCSAEMAKQKARG
ncbi:MAG: hypothetical protein VX288_10265 [Planctomycetota bacterium]|nr:hypothetical protein [Planctomycetota bacterium]